MQSPESPSCTVCLAGEVSRDPFFYDWRGHRYWVMRCRVCQHQFVYPLLTKEDQASVYDHHYFSREGDWVCGFWSADYVSVEPQLRQEAREVLDMLPLHSGHLLDVGCAGGVFLDEARSAGFSVIGVELNASMADHARSRYGLDVITARIEDIGIDRWHRCFDVITFLDCLEHVPYPRSALQKSSHWLKPGGFILIRGPLTNRRLARLKEAIRRLVRVSKRLPGYPLEVNTFNKNSLTHLLRSTGFVPEGWIHEASNFANLLGRRVDTGIHHPHTTHD